MNFDEVANEILSGIDPKWPDIYKIRYIYTQLGTRLAKDTDFFFSVDNKLDYLNLSHEELKKVYNSVYGRDNRVICYSACYMLGELLKRAGIESKIIKSNLIRSVEEEGDVLNIYHWLLVAFDENKNAYFLSLSPDLPYIQENLKTRHFAMNIPYVRELTKGRTEQVYEGEEYKPTLIDDEELYNIDKEIGYLKYQYKLDNQNHYHNDWYYNYNDTSLFILKDNLKNNKMYYQILARDTEFYNDMFTFIGENGKKRSFDETYIKDLTDEDIRIWIIKLCYNVTNRLKQTIAVPMDIHYFVNDFNYDKWLYSICNSIHKMDNFNYSKWSKEVKDGKKIDQMDYDNIINILDKTNGLVNCIKQRKNGDFNQLLNMLSFHFIDRRFIFDKSKRNEYVNNVYIAKKLSTLLPFVFSANEIRTPFNDREYNEKIVIIKQLLEIMFSELNKSNSNVEDYNKYYPAVFNRIHLYAIKNKETFEYAIILNIVGLNDQVDYYYYYNPKTNEFKTVDIFSISKDYIIVSDRFKSKLEEYEDYDDVKKRK